MGAKRDDAIARLTAELERIAAARERTRSREQRSRRDAEEAAQPRPNARCATTAPWAATCARPGRAGWSLTGRRSPPRRGWTASSCSTSDPDLSAEDVALGNKDLLEAEREFRDLKATLELRPVFHRLERRIRAHVLLCWLALLLVRVAERTTGQTWRRIALELGRVHEVTLAGDVGAVTQTTELTDAQRGIFRALDIAPPPRITHLDPA